MEKVITFEGEKNDKEYKRLDEWLTSSLLILDDIDSDGDEDIRGQRKEIIECIHGLRTSREEIVFTARPKIHSHSQIFRYGRSIFCLPHQPKFSYIFDICLHWVSVVRECIHHSIDKLEAGTKDSSQTAENQRTSGLEDKENQNPFPESPQAGPSNQKSPRKRKSKKGFRSLYYLNSPQESENEEQNAVSQDFR